MTRLRQEALYMLESIIIEIYIYIYIYIYILYIYNTPELIRIYHLHDHHHHHHHHRMFCLRSGPSVQAQEPKLQFCRRQVFHRKLSTQGSSFTSDWIGAVASRWFPHPTLSLTSEQTLKDLRSSDGHHEEGRRVGYANWALRTSPKFTTGVKISSIMVFD